MEMWSIYTAGGSGYSFPGCLGPTISLLDKKRHAFEHCGSHSPIEAWVLIFTFLVLLVCVMRVAALTQTHMDTRLLHILPDRHFVPRAEFLAGVALLSPAGMSVYETQKWMLRLGHGTDE